MKSLFKWQIISFISRGMAMIIGLLQSFIILRILSQAEWGIVQLALSIGGALGIYQNLGLASASTREIAACKDDSKIFKIFLTSVSIRYLIAVPLAVGLIVLAPKISTDIYKHPELVLPLQIYGVTILIQGFQTILNSVISGTKRFKHLFTYQVVIAFVSALLYIPFVYFYGMMGYFYAFLGFNIISTVSLSFLAFLPLKTKLVMPSKSDFGLLFKDIFSISIVIYLSKIIYTNWEKFGTNVLGLSLTPEKVAIFGFAVVFAKKIMSISDAVTDVNLPILSEKFVDDIEDFKRTFTHNFDKIFSFVIFSSSLAAFWAPEIIYFLAGKSKYTEYFDSLRLILPLLISFILYSFLNIINASILIPARMVKSMLLSFIYLLIFTALPFGAFYYLHKTDLLMGMSLSMLIGSILSYAFACWAIYKKLHFNHFTKTHFLVMVQGIAVGFAGYIDSSSVKAVLFLPLVLFLSLGIHYAKLLTKEELLLLKGKVVRFMEKFRLVKEPNVDKESII